MSKVGPVDIHYDPIGQGAAKRQKFSFLPSQQKGKSIFPLRPLRLCGERLEV